MKFRDYYRIMGLAPEATQDAVKTAYRTLARRYHPDVNKTAGTEIRFNELVEAHEVLQDVPRRAAYDRLRAAGWKDGQEMDAPPAATEAYRNPGPDGESAEDFSDFFQTLFGAAGRGGGSRGRRPRRTYADEAPARGADLHHALAITLEEAHGGGTRTLVLQAPPGDNSAAGLPAPRTLQVKIPVGMLPGTQMRLRGQGQPGSTPDLAGDLLLEITYTPHRWFTVTGRDVGLVLPVAPWEAVLGAQVSVPTLGGQLTVTIPPDAQNGQRLRLKGRGLPGSPPGDQYLTLAIVVPSTTSEQVRGLYRDLAKAANFQPRAAFGTP